MGEWVGEGTGAPGEGTGGFTFRLELQGRVLVRRNHADYPATKDRPDFSHEDLMVVYPSADGGATRAVYFDSEGHVIHYAATVSEPAKTWTFLSELEPSAPRYRLTYEEKSEGKLLIRFEIAPPDKPGAFQTYIQASAHRKGD
jgi:hypothetical protein